jgi:hypothetical protein
MTLDKHPQMSFPSKNVLVISTKHEISAVVYYIACLWTNKQHWTAFLQITERFESLVITSCSQQSSLRIEQGSMPSLIPFRLVANYIFLRTSHFFSSSSSSHFHTSMSWLHNHLSQVQVNLNWAEWQTIHPMHHLLRQSSNADTR